MLLESGDVTCNTTKKTTWNGEREKEMELCANEIHKCVKINRICDQTNYDLPTKANERNVPERCPFTHSHEQKKPTNQQTNKQIAVAILTIILRKWDMLL